MSDNQSRISIKKKFEPCREADSKPENRQKNESEIDRLKWLQFTVLPRTLGKFQQFIIQYIQQIKENSRPSPRSSCPGNGAVIRDHH